MNAVEAGIQVFVDMNGSRQNEMTVQSITYCFPIRCLKYLPFYKERYDLLINGSEGKQMRVVLHSEGTGDDYPKLELQQELKGSEIRALYMPYAIIAYSIDYIKHGDLMDGTGRSAFGIVSKDPLLGLESLQALGSKFVEIGYSQDFTEELGESLKEKYEDVAGTTLLNIATRKQTLIPKIQELLGKVVLPARSSRCSAARRRYSTRRCATAGRTCSPSRGSWSRRTSARRPSNRRWRSSRWI